MGIPAVAVGMFADPSKAMSVHGWQEKVWFPLLIILASMIVLFTAYYSAVDMEWLKDYLTQDYTEPDKRELAKKFITWKMLVVSSAAGVLIVMPFFYALTAAVLWAVARWAGGHHTYLKWFGFTAWTSIPTVLMLPLGLLQVYMTENRQIGPEQLNPTTLNQLFFHVARGTPWQSLLDSISVLSLWGTIIMIIGLRTWAGFSTLRSTLTVLLPYGFIYGLWALYAVYGSAA